MKTKNEILDKVFEILEGNNWCDNLSLLPKKEIELKDFVSSIEDNEFKDYVINNIIKNFYKNMLLKQLNDKVSNFTNKF